MEQNNTNSGNLYIMEQIFQFIMNYKESKLEQVWLLNSLGISNLWFIHKTTQKNWRGGRLKKVECYWYFKEEDLGDMIKYLDSQKFKQASRKDGNYSMFYEVAENAVWQITDSKLSPYNNRWYWYMQEYAKVFLHRKEFYLIRIYSVKKRWGKDFSNWYFKLEITFRETENKKLRRKVKLRINKPNSIIEIIKKIEANWKGFLPVLNKDDYSGGTQFEVFYNTLLK